MTSFPIPSHTRLLAATSLLALVFAPAAAIAQQATPDTPAATGPTNPPSDPQRTAPVAQPAADDGNAEVGLGDIVVTAQKRGVAERAQDVPIAITALNSAAIEQQNIRDLSSLTTSIPNVSLEGSGTFNGQANFEIRGFGISSSIPSVEPSVGVFIDGIYQGQTAGIITDLFDIESLEVLRGPQGTLFGRNTTGGAVSITTRRPGATPSMRGKITVESGALITAAASVEGALGTPDLRGKLAVYSSHDAGYFHNKFDNSKFGKNSTYFIRPTLAWDVTPDIDTTLIFEYGHIEGDGPVSQNIQTLDRFNVNLDYRGFTDTLWNRLTSETNIHVGFGNGIITNVAGWSKLHQRSGGDLDGLPTRFFNLQADLDQHQFSEELRYAGTFGPIELTIGGFFFTQKYGYIESRDLRSVAYPVGFGGTIDQNSAAGFGQARWNITDRFAVIAGGRYSWEEKTAKVATLVTAAPRCNLATLTCNYNFPGPPFADDGHSTWSRFSPKLGFQYRYSDDGQIYGNYSEGVRSGGYNVRSTVGGVSPGPYDQEIQDAFELGSKNDFLDRRLRVNLAVFYNKIRNLQRDVQTPDPVVGSAQVTANVGTAEIYGAEGELTVLPVRGLTIGGHFGYLHGRYTRLTADLNGALPGFGLDLDLVRLPNWSYGVNAAYEHELADTSKLRLATDFGHVDEAASMDNNLSFLSPRDIWNGNLSYELPGRSITVSFYVKNILDKLTWPQASPRNASLGGGQFLTINKGRVFGGGVNFHF